MRDKIRLTPKQLIALYNDHKHFAFYGGVAAGKSFTGSHFAIKMIREHPTLTGFIGANTYDQLSQATLRELFYWFDYYGLEFVIDKQPPPEWGVKKKFKKYSNILTVWNPVSKIATTIFTRVLGEGNPLRGVEFSWYWIDETRDTKKYTFDVLVARMRESHIIKGLITTTTNGESWDWELFVRDALAGDTDFGSIHMKTKESVDAGIITEEYYNLMRRTYSERMALQELDALHINVQGGQAYYAAHEENRLSRAPWGDKVPSRDRPLIVGCDFNFAPAPCVWIVGQIGPDEYGGDESDKDRPYFGNQIHWFKEISLNQTGTVDMAKKLILEYPDFVYRIFGDASGNRGTTSNAGETDYNQISEVLSDYQCISTIDVDQANPMVKDRVENMNMMLKNSLGEIRQTYDPNGCPLLDGDFRMVGWKPTIREGGFGRLDDGGDNTKTHASDAAGYAVWKLFPPGRRMEILESIPSAVREEIRSAI